MSYAELDQRILTAIEQRRSPLYCWKCGAEAERIADLQGRKEFRVIDGRLQALRKAGRIKFSNAKWERIKETP